MGSNGYMCSTCMEADTSLSHNYIYGFVCSLCHRQLWLHVHQLCHEQSTLLVQYDNHYVMGSHGNMRSKYDVQWPVNLIEGVSYLSP